VSGVLNSALLTFFKLLVTSGFGTGLPPLVTHDGAIDIGNEATSKTATTPVLTELMKTLVFEQLQAQLK
jgi:hypothetical protein